MGFASIAEAEARIAELEQENKALAQENKAVTRESIDRRKQLKVVKDFLESKNFDLQENLEDQWSTNFGKSKSDIDALISKVDKLSKQLERTEAEKAELKTQQEESSIKSELSSKMKDILGNEDLADLWIAKKKVKVVDGKIVFSDGERELPIDKHIETYRKSNPDRVRVQQNDGSSSHKTEGASGSGKTMNEAEWSKLSRTERDKFLVDGGEVKA